MSVHMRAHLTSSKTRRQSAGKSDIPSGKRTSWRKLAKSKIDKYTEPGLMLRGARHKVELTQKAVASKLGILPHHVSEMEHGKRSISKAMAKKLGVLFTVDYRIFL